MAITLSSSRSSTLEPVRKNRWVLQFATVPGNAGEAVNELAFAAHTCAVPAFSTARTQMSRMNEKFNYAGLPDWEEMSCTFYDFIGETTAGQVLYNWSQMIYNPITGQMFFKKSYSTSCTLAQLDPMGAIHRMWNIFYMFPTSVKLGDTLSYSDGEVSETTASFSYDFAIKANDVDTTPAGL